MRSFDEMNQLFAEIDRTFDHLRRRWWHEFGTPGFEPPALETPAVESTALETDEHPESTPALESSTRFAATNWPGATAWAHSPAWGRPVADRDAAVSLDEVDGEYVFVMDLPGFERDDVDLRYDDAALTVVAASDATREEDDESGATRAVRARRVSRRVSIPKPVVAEEITASLRNGVLEVRLPIVAEERDTGHRIDVE